MQSVSRGNFGLLIAYLLPGFVAVWGVSYLSPTVQAWLAFAPHEDPPTVGGFLYVTLASVAAGLTVSTIRWLLIDTLHHRTGVPVPDWNFALLKSQVDAYDLIVEHQYRYYQWYGNMLVAIAFHYIARCGALGPGTGCLVKSDVAYLLFILLFWIGSRDSLRKFYQRVGAMLGSSTTNQSPPKSPARHLAKSARAKNSASGTP